MLACRLISRQLPFHTVFHTSQGALRVRSAFLIGIRHPSGVLGIGEAAPLPGFGMESPKACHEALRRCASVLQSSTWPVEVPPERLMERLALEPCLQGAPAARFGVELALLDLSAQLVAKPLHRLLNPASTSEIPLNATIGAETQAASVEQALKAQAQGFGTLKLKVGRQAPEVDRQRLHAVRQALGDTVKLRVDANGAWSAKQALAVLERWAPLALEYVEQPVPAARLTELAWLTRHSPVPIALDESVSSFESARRALDAGAGQVFVLKPMALGGVIPALSLAHQAAGQGLVCVFTTMLEGVYGRTGALHTAAAHHGEGQPEGVMPACGLATGDLLAEDHIQDPPLPKNGWLSCGPGAGLGLPRPPFSAFPRAEA